MLILLMAFCDNLRRRVPLNFIALGLFVSGGIGDVLALLGHVFNLPTLSLCFSFQTVVEGAMLGSVAVCVLISSEDKFFFWPTAESVSPITTPT